MHIKSEELREMSPAERDALYDRLLEAARRPHPEAKEIISRRVRAFEIRYEVSSATMLSELGEGRRKETAEIASWLFWLSVLNRLNGDESRQA